MRRSLQSKLILSYLAVALITVLVVSVLIQLTSGQSLMNLVLDQQTAMLKETVTSYYIQNGSLDGLFTYFLSQGQPPRQSPPQPSGPDKKYDMRGVYGLVDPEFRAIFPILGYTIGEVVPENLIKEKISVEVDGKIVAYILPDTSYKFKLSNEEQLFLQRSRLAVGLAALAGVLVAIAMGFLLAGRLLKPIQQLTEAAQSLARGKLQQNVPITSHDELGLLTETFNQMSTDLAQADQQRKRMTADITHDLSTPLQIIAGYIEMIEEGEVQLTPQRIDIIKTELSHLRRLVSDLSTLTQVESGVLDMQIQVTQAERILEHVYQAYIPIVERQGVSLFLEANDKLPPIEVDEGRIEQVIKNLIENALRYTPRGGKITLSVRDENNTVAFRIADTGSGIDAEDLPYIFDRFYRADKARNINSGKMGLGLAICKALVTAQGGKIQADSPGNGQGTVITIIFNPSKRTPPIENV